MMQLRLTMTVKSLTMKICHNLGISFAHIYLYSCLSFIRGRKESQIDKDFGSLVTLGKDRLTNLDMTDDFSTNVRVFTVHKVPKQLSSNITEDVNDSSAKVKEYNYRCESIEKSLQSLYSDIKKNISDIVNRKRNAAIANAAKNKNGTSIGLTNALMRTDSTNADSSGETILEDEYFGSYDCKVLMLKDIVDWFRRVQDYHSAYNKGDSNKKRHLEHQITYRRFCVILNLQEVNIILTKNKLYYIIPDYVPDIGAASLNQMSTKASHAAVWSAAGGNRISLRDYMTNPDHKNSFIYYVLSVLGGDNVEVGKSVWQSDNKYEFSNKTASSFCLRIYTIYFYLFLHSIKHRIDELNNKQGKYTIVTMKMDGGSTGNSCMLSLNFAKELTYVKRELVNINTDIAKLVKLLNGVKTDDDNLRCMSLDGYDVAFFGGLETDEALRANTRRGGAKLHNETLKLSDPFKTIDYHGTEMLIKHYILDFEALDNEVDYMMNELQFNEKSLELRLETSRNELTLINTYFTITSAFFGFGGFIAGIFGMNLDNSTTTEPGLVQSQKGSFIVVSVISAAFIVVGITTTYYYLRYKNIIPEKLNISKGEMGST